jgi:phospholipase C
MRSRGSIACSIVVALCLVSPASAKTIKKNIVNHVIVVMMENRSFDHLLGWHPTADAEQNLTFLDDTGTPHQTFALPPDYQGCSHPDPDHSWGGGRIDYDNGKMDGFLFNDCDAAVIPQCPRSADTPNDQYVIGFYGKDDRPFFNALALEYTTFDRFFSAILAETFPNRVFTHAAQTDRLTNTFDISTLPTIWDELAAAHVSARYYYSDASFLWLWGNKYDSISASYDQFLEDAKSGSLPSVAFVEPRFVGEEQGVSGDDHPHADIRTGDAFLSQTFRAVAGGPQWGSTVFIVTYDEWGGFFDHVPPPLAAAANDVDPPDPQTGKVLLGMRIPVVVASPFTRGNPASPQVNHTVFDNTSILKLIEWRWNLAPLTPRDASNDVGNLASALNLATPDRTVPSLPSPVAPSFAPCPSNSASASSANREPDLGDLMTLRPGG